MRTLVIGDIHGGLRALKQVLERAKFNPDEDLLITIGDIVDGWSESPQCVDYLLTIPSRNRIDIRGNHDKWCGDWLTFGVADYNWYNNGGLGTKEQYENYKMYHDFDIDAHMDFFRKQINYYVDDKNRAFVHGGYMSMDGLGHDTFSTYYWDRSLWNIALSGKTSQNMPKKLRHYEEIFIGHTSTTFWDSDKPMNPCNVWNVDTGGGGIGKLTVMDVDTKEYWQSDLLKDLYPKEFIDRG